MTIQVYKNHYLRLNAITSLQSPVVIILARVKRPDGHVVPIELRMDMAAMYTPQTKFVQLPDGDLISVLAYEISTNHVRGRTFVRVTLDNGYGDNASYEQVLIQDYIHHANFLSWPGSLIRSSQEGPGYRIMITVPAPPPGADFDYTIPANRINRLHQATMDLVTGVAVPVRTVRLMWAEFTIPYCHAVSRTTQPANHTYGYCFNSGGDAGFDDPYVNVLMDRDIMLSPDARVFSTIGGIDPGDAVNTVLLYFEEWLLL